MKTSRLLPCLLAFTAMLFVSRAAFAASAATAKNEPAPEWAELFGGASLPVVWQSMVAASARIDAALAARKLDGVAAWAETIHLGAHALDDQFAFPDPERAKRLRGALRQTAKIADDVLGAANRQEPDHAAEAQRRLSSALSLVKGRLPPEIATAAGQEVRFASPAAPAPAPAGGAKTKGATTQK